RFDTPSVPAVVMGEGARLVRVIDNLIDNAISFSPDGGLIVIRTAREEEDMVRVTVEDEGPGVPEEARDKVFNRFQSLRPPGEAFGTHSGLGLAIAKTIVDAHRGEIGVEPRRDRLSGARFVVRLPARP
nr:ATP-binding protein [Pseudomonadota bacterium]